MLIHYFFTSDCNTVLKTPIKIINIGFQRCKEKVQIQIPFFCKHERKEKDETPQMISAVV
jgi:hypothetical protein